MKFMYCGIVKSQILSLYFSEISQDGESVEEGEVNLQPRGNMYNMFKPFLLKVSL